MSTMQIDHLFIRARAGAPEAEQLRAFGLTEGSGNRHPGQGTENRRFFFHNAFLELLWIADDEEVRSAQTSPTLLAERLADGSPACPFGVCFRPADGGDNDDAPFPSWQYTPPYLPPGMRIDIGADVPASEPMWFHLPKGVAPSSYAQARRQPLQHAAGVTAVTSVTLTLPPQALSAPAQAACRGTGLTLREGDAYLMEICFDHGAQGTTHDCRPKLPLLLHL